MSDKEYRIQKAQSVALAYIAKGMTLREAFFALCRSYHYLVHDLPVGPVLAPVRKQMEVKA